MPPILAETESLSRELIVRLLDGSLQGAFVVAIVVLGVLWTAYGVVGLVRRR